MAEMQKLVSLKYHLFNPEIVWFLRTLGLFQKFCRVESDAKMQFGCRAPKLMHYFC